MKGEDDEKRTERETLLTHTHGKRRFLDPRLFVLGRAKQTIPIGIIDRYATTRGASDARVFFALLKKESNHQRRIQ